MASGTAGWERAVGTAEHQSFVDGPLPLPARSPRLRRALPACCAARASVVVLAVEPRTPRWRFGPSDPIASKRSAHASARTASDDVSTPPRQPCVTLTSRAFALGWL